MTLPSDSVNIITLDYLNDCYKNTVSYDESDKFNMADRIIGALIQINEVVETFPDYAQNKNLVREFVVRKLFEEKETHFSDVDSATYLEFSRKIDSFLFCYHLFLCVEKTDFDDEVLYIEICKCKDRARMRKDFSYLPEIIVSMTSFPERIDKVYIALHSIFSQSFKADRVILWLSEEQFPDKEKQLPASLMEYVHLGLEIRWCKKDLRPHKKYFYVMQEYPKALIITVDDDLVYDRQMTESLVVSYMHFPYAVSATRVHLIKQDENGKISPYYQWANEFSGIIGKPSMQLFSTSGAGTLYPPNCMDKELFNENNICSLCLNADDLWLKIMQIKNETPVVLAKRNEKLVYVPQSQETALYHRNGKLNENDIQLNNILEIYNEDNSIIERIFQDNYTTTDNIIGVDIFEDNEFGLLDVAEKYMYLLDKNEKKYELLNENFLKLEKLKNLINDNYENLKVHVARLKDNYAKRVEELTRSEEDLKDLNKKYTFLKEQHNKLTMQHNKTTKELEDIRKSISFRIGRIITFIPRKIRGGIKCYKENGFIYTVKRFLAKVRNNF